MAKEKNSFVRGRGGVAALVLCGLGAAVSAYLFVSGLLGGSDLCLTGEGCDMVRGSRYSRLGGVPVSLLGILGYSAMIAAAFLPLGRKAKWNVLFCLSAAAVGFSAYLTYLEIFAINAFCSWCLVSAAVSAALFALAGFGKLDSGGRFFTLRTSGAAALALALAFSVPYLVQAPSSSAGQAAGASFYQLGLAKYLSGRGAVMYGSHTCGHCTHQKELFGTAFSLITYVECSRSGPDPAPELCAAKNITGYPTWEIEGAFYPGARTLEDLARISGYSDE